MATVSHVTIELLTIPPGAGHDSAKLLVRCHSEDKALIDRAATALGMTQAQFMRVALIKTAQAVLEQVPPSHIGMHTPSRV